MIKYITDQREALATVEHINRYSFVGLDIETNGLEVFENQILLIQITIPDDDLTTFIYDARVLHMSEILAQLSDSITFILHNGKFDLKFLRRFYGFLPQNVFDTMIAETLLTCGIGKLYSSLNELTQKYLGYALVKEIRDSFLQPIVFFSQEQLNYAADDSQAEVRLYPLLVERLDKMGLNEVALIEFKLTRVLIDMELTGVRFDERVWKGNIDKTQVKKDEAEKNLRELYAKVGSIKVTRKHKGVDVVDTIDAAKINLNSYQQVIPVLAAFGIKVDSTSFDTLSNIHHPAVEALITYRKYTKRLSAFGQAYIDDFVQKGRVHASTNQIGAYTGRFSYERPNLQQVINPNKDISKDVNYRLAFIADQGSWMIKSDYSQIELRIATQISKEPAFIEAYLHKKDMHTLTASNVFKIPYDQVGKESKERAISKNINFACVPMDTEILTANGFKTYYDVSVGDRVYGYNPQSGNLELTEIEDVVHYENAPTLELRNSNFNVVSTPNHRWYGDKRKVSGDIRKYFDEIFTTETMSQEHRIRVSARSTTPKVLDLTDNEVGLIAWILSDGSIKISKDVDAPSQSHGSKVQHEAWVFQSIKNKTKLDLLRKYLTDVPVKEYKPDKNGIVRIRILAPYIRNLWERALLNDITFEQFALYLSPSQRTEYVKSIQLCEGDKHGVIAQNPGDFANSIIVSLFLEGNFPSVYKHYQHYNGSINLKIRPRKGFITGQRLKKTDAGNREVWCVKTKLNTWVIRQNNQIMITGNTLYGSGPSNLVGKFQIPRNEAVRILDEFHKAYPVLSRTLKDLGDSAVINGYVATILGRRRNFQIPSFSSPDFYGEIAAIKREGGNHAVQGTSADMTKLAMVMLYNELQAIGGQILITVHDEIVCQVPDGFQDIGADLVKTCMVDAGKRMIDVIPVEVDVHVGKSWGG